MTASGQTHGERRATRAQGSPVTTASRGAPDRADADIRTVAATRAAPLDERVAPLLAGKAVAASTFRSRPRMKNARLIRPIPIATGEARA